MNRAATRLMCFVFAIATGFSANAAEQRADKVLVGYLFGAPRAINFRLYTHLCHAFLVADADGRRRPTSS